MTAIAPRSRFHRIVRKLGRCSGAEPPELLQAYVDLLESHGDQLLGVYRGDIRNDDIAFAESGCVFTNASGRVQRLPYSAIQTVKYPLPTSGSIDLVLVLSDGSTVEVRVVGREGNFRDVFEVGRFFMRVAEDLGRGHLLEG